MEHKDLQGGNAFEAEAQSVTDSQMKNSRTAQEVKPSKRKYRKRKNQGIMPDSEERFCTIVDKELLRKIRIIAKREGLNVKTVVNAAFEKAVRSYERKHGELKDTRCDTSDLF